MIMKQENAESYRAYSRNKRGKGKLVIKFQIRFQFEFSNKIYF